MENANKMRIICDPFKKEIEYQWYDLNIGDYIELEPENSKLASEEFVNTTIQSRAYEIASVINSECNVGNVGLDIMFVGTKDDYIDFARVIETYYSKSNLRCIPDKYYYHPATEVMPKIKSKFEEVHNTLNEYTEEKIAKQVSKYNDAVKPSISLCIMGLYSAGKSTFINSVIGAEVLPSASDPTTAKVYKITCRDNYEIKFLFDGKECVLSFKGGSYKPNSTCSKEIIKKLQEIVDSEFTHDEIFHMNKALDIINNYSSGDPKEHNIGDIIEVEIPFRNTSLPVEEFDFVIYDTPGSNSDNNVKHFEVLKDALDEQTNALPIFLTTPDTMDAKDNNELLELIEDTGTALDTTNSIIVVNKSDEKGPAALAKKKESGKDLKITKWKPTGIFFVSSLIGIASKKNNPVAKEEWLDEDMHRLYKRNKGEYEDDEMKLFEYNIVDQSKRDQDIQYKDDALSTHLYKNSGLEAVESEIVEYARKYALYNKCKQASAYLQEAIRLCVENVKETEEKLNEALEDAKIHFDEKKRALCDQLEEKKKNCDHYNAEFQENMEESYILFTKGHQLVEDDTDSRKMLREEFNAKWISLKEVEKKAKEKRDNGWALDQIQRYVDEKYNNLLRNFENYMNQKIDSFWKEKSENFKSECKNVVHDNKYLTVEQKEILESIVLKRNDMKITRMEFNLRNVGVIRHKRFLFWELKREKFVIKACSNQLIEKFNDVVRLKMQFSVVTNSANFKNWADDLRQRLITELCKFNSGLGDIRKKIDQLKDEIDSKQKCEKLLNESKEYIDMLLDIQGGEAIG